MARLIILVTVTLFLATNSQASSVLQKSYGYRYESVRDTGSDREFVICDNTHRSHLVPELKELPLAMRFGDQATALPIDPVPLTIPKKSPYHSNISEYRLEKTVLFRFDSSRVEDNCGLSLLATTLKTDPSVTAIRIKGFTCDLGSKEYNDRLAMRRAVAVGSLLGKAGLRVDEVSGEGKCCYVPGKKSFSRRVEISVMRSLAEEKNDEK
ncbi:MAG: OmpA family protein [Desulfuromonadales bacterium]|nr:OmpA family protein [Desulfuromonadales bacterium]